MLAPAQEENDQEMEVVEAITYLVSILLADGNVMERCEEQNSQGI